MATTNESLRQAFNEGIVEGMVGKDEDTSKARILKSSEPIKNEMLGIKKMYLACMIVIVLGCVIPILILVGVAGLGIVYCIDKDMTSRKMQRLRAFKFKFAEGISDEQLFQKMQSVFITKYNMLVEKREDGVLMLTYDGYTYDVILNEDNTFIIWWRMELNKALFSNNNYKSYRKILAAMGIIAFEIQQAFNIV